MKTLLVAVAVALLVMAGLAVVAWLGQERIIFQPPAVLPPETLAVRRLEFRADDGTPLFAYVVGDDDAATDSGLVVHFHGNAEIAAWEIPWAEELARRTGFAVLIPEYRGYSGIPGRPSYDALGRDARATWKAAQSELGAVPERTVLHGFSLGSAIAAEAAATISPRALVLEAPFTSAEAMAARSGPLLRGPFWRVIGRVHYDTRAVVSRIDARVSVAQGASDRIVPPAMGREVFAAARHKGEYLSVPGAGHNDMRAGAGYWEWLVRAVRPSVDAAR